MHEENMDKSLSERLGLSDEKAKKNRAPKPKDKSPTKSPKKGGKKKGEKKEKKKKTKNKKKAPKSRTLLNRSRRVERRRVRI